jgi:hypothetical protein
MLAFERYISLSHLRSLPSLSTSYLLGESNDSCGEVKIRSSGWKEKDSGIKRQPMGKWRSAEGKFIISGRYQ